MWLSIPARDILRLQQAQATQTIKSRFDYEAGKTFVFHVRYLACLKRSPKVTDPVYASSDQSSQFTSLPPTFVIAVQQSYMSIQAFPAFCTLTLVVTPDFRGGLLVWVRIKPSL